MLDHETVNVTYRQVQREQVFFKNTLVNATERKGNLLLLLCVSHTDGVQNHLFPYLRQQGIDPEEFILSLKLYLSLEEWYHSVNEKSIVRKSRPFIADVIQRVHKIFQENLMI